MRSAADTWYQDGLTFHAVVVTGSVNVEARGAFCVTAITSASSAGRSWQKLSPNLSCLIQTYPSESGATFPAAAATFHSPIWPTLSPASGANAATYTSPTTFGRSPAWVM